MTVPQKVSEYIDYAPPADVIEDHGLIKLIIDVPGANTEGLTVNVEAGELELSADTGIKRCDKTIRYQRTFQISDQVDVANIKAVLENGVLELTLPKHEHAKVHKIKIGK